MREKVGAGDTAIDDAWSAPVFPRSPLPPNTMRLLDRMLGVPLCFLLSVLLRGYRIVAGLPKSALPRRVLFIGLAEMGSVVLADPALVRVRDVYRCPPLFLIFAHNRDSLRLAATVAEHDVFTLRATGLAVLFADSIRFARWARQNGVDTVIDIEPFSRFSAILALCSGARIRAGFQRVAAEGLYRGSLHTHPVRYQPDVHIAHNLLAIVDAAFAGHPRQDGESLPAGNAPLRVTARAVTGAERARVAGQLARIGGAASARRRIVLINPNVGDMLPQRRWPLTHYVQIIRELLASADDILVALIGSVEDAALVAPLLDQIGDPRCISLAGAVSLAELPALFERSALLISSDSGPAHFAAVSAMPVIALFGPETPVLYRPLGRVVPISAGLPCSPCVSPANQRRSACRDNRCMQAISVSQVMREAMRLLDEQSLAATDATQMAA